MRFEVNYYASNSRDLIPKNSKFKEITNEFFRLTSTRTEFASKNLQDYIGLPKTLDDPNWKTITRSIKEKQDYLLCELIIEQIKDIKKFVTDLKFYFNEEIKSEQFRKIFTHNRRNLRLRLKTRWLISNPDVQLFLDRLTYMIIDYESYIVKIDYMINHCLKFYI
jgi:hypothetical protein